MSLFQRVEFFASFDDPRYVPTAIGKEVAIAGRSNVGKSSAINALANRKRLACAPKSLDRTRHINFFSLGHARYLVDLSGYDCAKLPANMGGIGNSSYKTACKPERHCLGWYWSWTFATR